MTGATGPAGPDKVLQVRTVAETEEIPPEIGNVPIHE